MWKKNLVTVCAAGLGFVLLAGCGNSSTSPVTSPPAPPASLAQLQKIVLQPGDLSGGWKSEPFKADIDPAVQAEPEVLALL